MNFKNLVLIFSLIATGCGGNEEVAQQSEKHQAPPAASFQTTSFVDVRTAYKISKVTNGYKIVHNQTQAAVDVDGSPILKFKDVSMDLALALKSTQISQKDLNSILELYVAFFNRVPDAGGMSYWIDQFINGVSIEQIAGHFYNAAIAYSSVTGYTSTMSDTEFVKIIYKNVLGRSEVDAEGLNYWTTQLGKGTETRASLIKTILGAAHSFKGDPLFGWVADLLDNKVLVSKHFSIELGLSYNTPEESITNGMLIADAITAFDTTASMDLIALNKFPIFNLLSAHDTLGIRIGYLPPRSLSEFLTSLNKKGALGFQFFGVYYFDEGFFSLFSKSASKSSTYEYAGSSSEKTSVAFLSALNLQGKKGFRFWSDITILNNESSALFIQEKSANNSYQYKAKTPAASSTQFLESSSLEGEAGSRYVGNYGFTDQQIALYLKDENHKTTFSYQLIKDLNTTDTFLNKAGALGANGFRFCGTMVFNDGSFAIFIRDNGKNDNFTYKVREVGLDTATASHLQLVLNFTKQVNEEGESNFAFWNSYWISDKLVNIYIGGSSFERYNPFGG